MRDSNRKHRATTPPADRKTLDEVARRAWLRDGVVILWPDRLTDAWDRQHVINLAAALYGRRHG
jgi:hypothetical protein